MRNEIKINNVTISDGTTSSRFSVEVEKGKRPFNFDGYYEDGSYYAPKALGMINWSGHGSVSTETAREFAKALLIAADYVDEKMKDKKDFILPQNEDSKMNYDKDHEDIPH